ncbi:MAG: hypothetical protein ACI9WC_000206 [Arenicella sp.]|jgi:hypothetical protein
MSCANPSVNLKSPWGHYGLSFELPAVSISFTGLSLSQQRSIQQRYAGFICPQGQSNEKPQFTCQAYKMNQVPGVPFSDLVRDGQYAPLQRRRSGAIDITGYDFRASIPLEETYTAGSLGVVNEDELSCPSVVENVLRVFTAYKAVESGGVILHSAGLVHDEQAYIFVGRSNAGKTTLTRKAYKYGAKVLSDDINMVLPCSNKSGFNAHAVPFSGEFGRTLEHANSRESYPLAALVLLEQGELLRVTTAERSDAVAKLLVGSPFVNMDTKQAPLLFDAVTDLAAKVPVLRLQSARDEPIENIMNAVKRNLSNV